MPRLGVLGTLVWDTIHPPEGAAAVVSDWGGIAYSLAGFEACLSPAWRVLPILKVGADLGAEADRFLSTLRSVEGGEAVVSVAEPNNRVDLFYASPSRRCERLRGGVPGWTWPELAPAALSCDALYVNLVAGWELELDAARSLREAFSGPIYVDVHSLLLSVGADGVREPRRLPAWPDWRRCFDHVQMNEDELTTLAGPSADPVEEARSTVLGGPRSLFVTRGAAGAWWFAREGGEVRSGSVASPAVSDPDPTGCGDVWGAACFSSLLEGSAVAEAARRASRTAARAAARRGTAGLAGALADRPPCEPGGEA